MKVLFISSGNSKNGINPIIKNQGESLKTIGIKIDYFLIKGHGLLPYIKHIKLLRKHLKNNDYDIFHAHYSLSSLTALLAGCRPLIVSLMGTDVYGDVNKHGRFRLRTFYLVIITQFIQLFADHLIVKSSNLYRHIRLKKKCTITPNGVDIRKFVPLDKKIEREKLSLKTDKKYILYLNNKNDTRKNFSLLQSAININQNVDYELIAPFPLNHHDVVYFLNATDVLVSTSYAEGSPNIIKEAMACNCPIVSTNVGDVSWLFGDEAGHFISGYEPSNLATQINEALRFANTIGKTNGRKRIIDLKLDAESVASRIKEIYINTISLNEH